MSPIARELDQQLKKLHPATALMVEQLVRDVLGLVAGEAGDRTRTLAGDQWPQGYFEETAGSFAGETFDAPQDEAPPEREAW